MNEIDNGKQISMTRCCNRVLQLIFAKDRQVLPFEPSLVKYTQTPSSQQNSMSLNCLLFVETTIYIHTNISLTLFGSHSYVRYGHEHQPGSVRAVKNCAPTIPLEATPLLSHIGDSRLIIKSHMLNLILSLLQEWTRKFTNSLK